MEQILNVFKGHQSLNHHESCDFHEYLKPVEEKDVLPNGGIIMADFSLARTLLFSDAARFRQATQSTFLKRAAQGKVPKDILGQWLANDPSLNVNYILDYI
ncbi:hypothetical protein ED733_008615 [Metarhizium rileyi]|uniref:Uncharacterized protein n=1 Tax=Metarhizium rileyi (strain RCEF 4871) TaxID=1649241 RepID=A0A5C6GPV4_METRR|nr:hypothetical protein ED733_008615 [Metarhizium rileyi]